MNVVDSSGWLEYFVDGPNAEFFAPAVEDTERLIVPSLSLLEVFRRTLQLRGEEDALEAVTLMQQGRVVDLSADLAIDAARLGLASRLSLADSVLLATAHRYKAAFWTQDADVKGLEGVRFVQRRAR